MTYMYVYLRVFSRSIRLVNNSWTMVRLVKRFTKFNIYGRVSVCLMVTTSLRLQSIEFNQVLKITGLAMKQVSDIHFDENRFQTLG